jgi:hypothetical protein
MALGGRILGDQSGAKAGVYIYALSSLLLIFTIASYIFILARCL